MFLTLNKEKRIFSRLLAILLVTLTIVVSVAFFAVHAAETNYIYFDIAAGKVTINDSKYTGYVFKTVDGVTTTETVSGTHNANNKYYVYQSSASNKTATGLIGDSTTVILPEYDRMTFGGKSWEDYVTNNTDPNAVADNWSGAATAVGRTIAPEENFIDIVGKSTFDVTIDDLWIKYNHTGNRGSAGTGSISFRPQKNGKAYIRLKGDNRVACVNYQYLTNDLTETTGIYFENGEDKNSPLGTLTAIGYSVKDNHWNSAIGSTNGAGHDACGIFINGGVIYAGGRNKTGYTGHYQMDNCTAIGGGGNGKGVVTINGGKVTAVAFTTGTAIGGGIGYSVQGGEGYVTITDGDVYAYNYGFYFEKLIPSAAIGGAGSHASKGEIGNVSISGGKVYAYSMGGSAIGGGSSTSMQGGNAVVSLSGTAHVTAISAAGKINGKDCVEGACIGGGTAGDAGEGSGGSAILSVSENATLIAGSVGGGACNNSKGNIGHAEITVSGGTISAQFIMAEGAASNCKFTMSGGIIDNSDHDDRVFKFLKKDGGSIYMDDSDGVAEMSGGTIKSCKADRGGAIYMTAGKFTLSNTGSINSNSATICGGAAYLGGGTFNVEGGNISSNTSENGAGVYLANGTLSVSGGTLYNNHAGANGGAAYLGGGTFSVTGGSINKNIADEDGGGAYVNGGNVEIDGGSITENTAAVNGGGVCVNNGNVTMTKGQVDGNTATAGYGGGLYVSSDSNNVKVEIKSGSISNNEVGNDTKTLGESGGALAVVGDKNKDIEITVIIGENIKHEFDPEGNATNHSCPVIDGNTAVKDGGALYVTGAHGKTFLNMYCLLEETNSADGDEGLSNFMMIDGGSVLFSSLNSDGTEKDHGNIRITGTMHVTGGQVDLKGTMDIIELISYVTVDITAGDDYYNDDREGQDEYYTIEYFENFKDPTTGVVTGRYKAYQYKKGEETEIKGVMYDHDGYTIVGWLENETDVYYKVGSKYTGNVGNLKLYAVWKLNGYLVTFNANVKEGDSYKGETASITAQYNETKQFPENGYEYPGYIFKYWSDKEGTKQYKPGDEFKNLSLVNDTTITLYAQWEECKHDPSAPEYPASFTYTSSGNVITLNCSCKAFSETATVKAENTTYDTHEHPANVVYSGSNWGLKVSYLKDDVSIDHIPTNAGSYEARIECGGKMAFIKYTISKAKLQRPSKPIISVNETTLTVTPVGNEPETNIEPKYQLKYYIGDAPYEISWSDNTSYVLSNAYTSYYIEVFYPGNENYEDSDIATSDAKYFIGKVKLTFVSDEGIVYQIIQKDMVEEALRGLTIDVRADNGFYIIKTTGLTADVNTGATPNVTYTGETERRYVVSNIPAECELTITITGAKRKATLDASLEPGEKFGKVEGNEAKIAKDSAFSSYFKITNYDTSAYSTLTLDFKTALPSGTTVIMRDMVTGKYWYYKADGAITSIPLENFSEMGVGGGYSIATETTYLEYIFVVDFSKATSEPMATELKPVLSATTDDDGYIPNFNEVIGAGVNVKAELEAITFDMEDNTSDDGMEKELSVSFETEGEASRWEGRASALILELKAGSPELPGDTVIKVIEGEYSTEYAQKGEGVFIIPLRSINEEISLTLYSALFTDSETEYTFTATYVTADSYVGGSPFGGDEHKEIDLTFTKAEKVSPSLKIEGNGHVFEASETMNLTFTYDDMVGCTISAEIFHKKSVNGAYTSTAWKEDIDVENDNVSELLVSLGGYSEEKGNYCLRVTVKDGSGTLFEVPYYFIIK